MNSLRAEKKEATTSLFFMLCRCFGSSIQKNMDLKNCLFYKNMFFKTVSEVPKVRIKALKLCLFKSYRSPCYACGRVGTSAEFMYLPLKLFCNQWLKKQVQQYTVHFEKLLQWRSILRLRVSIPNRV